MHSLIRRAARAAAIALFGSAIACTAMPAPSTTADAKGGTVVEPIQIDAVQVQDRKRDHVSAHVTGVVGDGCATLLPLKQSRERTLIVVRIERERRTDGPCTQIAKIYDETLQLEGEFPPAEYTLRVNDVERVFRVE